MKPSPASRRYFQTAEVPIPDDLLERVFGSEPLSDGEHFQDRVKLSPADLARVAARQRRAERKIPAGAVDIIKTWPANVSARTVAHIFRPHIFGEQGWSEYYFTLGRGKPQKPIGRLFFTWRGRILGSFIVDRVVINDGSLPRLSHLDGEESDWQIKPDRWVAICCCDCVPLKERVFMGGFRGWRYFSLQEFKETPESRFRW